MGLKHPSALQQQKRQKQGRIRHSGLLTAALLSLTTIFKSATCQGWNQIPNLNLYREDTLKIDFAAYAKGDYMQNLQVAQPASDTSTKVTIPGFWAKNSAVVDFNFKECTSITQGDRTKVFILLCQQRYLLKLTPKEKSQSVVTVSADFQGGAECLSLAADSFSNENIIYVACRDLTSLSSPKDRHGGLQDDRGIKNIQIWTVDISQAKPTPQKLTLIKQTKDHNLGPNFNLQSIQTTFHVGLFVLPTSITNLGAVTFWWVALDNPAKPTPSERFYWVEYNITNYARLPATSEVAYVDTDLINIYFVTKHKNSNNSALEDYSMTACQIVTNHDLQAFQSTGLQQIRPDLNITVHTLNCTSPSSLASFEQANPPKINIEAAIYDGFITASVILANHEQVYWGDYNGDVRKVVQGGVWRAPTGSEFSNPFTKAPISAQVFDRKVALFFNEKGSEIQVLYIKWDKYYNGQNPVSFLGSIGSDIPTTAFIDLRFSELTTHKVFVLGIGAEKFYSGWMSYPIASFDFGTTNPKMTKRQFNLVYKSAAGGNEQKSASFTVSLLDGFEDSFSAGDYQVKVAGFSNWNTVLPVVTQPGIRGSIQGNAPSFKAAVVKPSSLQGAGREGLGEPTQTVSVKYLNSLQVSFSTAGSQTFAELHGLGKGWYMTRQTTQAGDATINLLRCAKDAKTKEKLDCRVKFSTKEATIIPKGKTYSDKVSQIAKIHDQMALQGKYIAILDLAIKPKTGGSASIKTFILLQDLVSGTFQVLSTKDLAKAATLHYKNQNIYAFYYTLTQYQFDSLEAERVDRQLGDIVFNDYTLKKMLFTVQSKEDDNFDPIPFDATFLSKICPVSLRFVPGEGSTVFVVDSNCLDDTNGHFLHQFDIHNVDDKNAYILYINSIELTQAINPAFCLTSSFVHVADLGTSAEKTKSLYLAFSLKKGDLTEYTIPFSGYNGVDQLSNLLCNAQKNILHVIGKNSKTGKDYLITINGDLIGTPSRRVHSVTAELGGVAVSTVSYDPFSDEMFFLAKLGTAGRGGLLGYSIYKTGPHMSFQATNTPPGVYQVSLTMTPPGAGLSRVEETQGRSRLLSESENKGGRGLGAAGATSTFKITLQDPVLGATSKELPKDEKISINLTASTPQVLTLPSTASTGLTKNLTYTPDNKANSGNVKITQRISQGELPAGL